MIHVVEVAISMIIVCIAAEVLLSSAMPIYIRSLLAGVKMIDLSYYEPMQYVNNLA